MAKPTLEAYGYWLGWSEDRASLFRFVGMEEVYIILAKCSPNKCHTMRLVYSKEEFKTLNLDEVYNQTLIKFNGLKHG